MKQKSKGALNLNYEICLSHMKDIPQGTQEIHVWLFNFFHGHP